MIAPDRWEQGPVLLLADVGFSAPLALEAAYLLGSIPFGLLVVRLVKGIDLRTIGSGNIGATNAARAAGRGAGLAVFALDCAKGALAAGWLAPWCAAILGETARPQILDSYGLAVACGGAAVVGHCFPVYLGFRGGKGVATGCGALLALDARIFLWGGALWLLCMAATRLVSLASILMGLAFPIAAWFLGGPARNAHLVGTLLLASLILVRHRSNIMRIVKGTEPKAFAQRSRASAPKADQVQPPSKGH